MLDAAIWQELGGEKANDAEAVYHALGTLLSRWLLARSDYPEMEAIKLFGQRMNSDPKQKRERFQQLTQNSKVKTGKAFAADLRKSRL